MISPQAGAREPVLQCDQADSVLRAIEFAWRQHHASSGGIVLGLYVYLAQLLNQEGFIVDTVDGLAVLEHCRRRNLPVVDILYELENRVRAAGYQGERLGLADFRSNGNPVYVFHDASRFQHFAALKEKVSLRLTPADGGHL